MSVYYSWKWITLLMPFFILIFECPFDNLVSCGNCSQCKPWSDCFFSLIWVNTVWSRLYVQVFRINMDILSKYSSFLHVSLYSWIMSQYMGFWYLLLHTCGWPGNAQTSQHKCVILPELSCSPTHSRDVNEVLRPKFTLLVPLDNWACMYKELLLTSQLVECKTLDWWVPGSGLAGDTVSSA